MATGCSVASDGLKLVSNTKKIALEALDRRLAAAAKAKSDILQKELRKFDKTRHKTQESHPQLPKGPTIAPSLIQKKEHVAGEKVPDGDSHPIYHKISEAIDEKLMFGNENMKGSSDKSAVYNVAYDIIQKGDAKGKIARGAKQLKYDRWILLDNYVPNDNKLAEAKKVANKNQTKRSRNHMTPKQHRKCGSFKLPKESLIFDQFMPMHEMWKDYIQELSKSTREKQLADCLLESDLHGAYLIVLECKNVHFRGVNGIMIRETPETFGILSQDNRFRVVPKAGSVFALQADCWKVTLYGDKLCAKK